MAKDVVLHKASGTQVRLEQGRAIVTSESVALPFRQRTKTAPGTGVRLDGELWEVVSGIETLRGGRWELVPWTSPQAVRSVVTLNAASIEAVIRQERTGRSARWHRLVTTVLAPVLGFAPGPWQERWRNQWGYPAMAAVIVTSLIELVAGAAASLQLMGSAFGSGVFFPGFLRHFVILGPFLLAEGAVRLAVSNAHGQPVGSALSAMLLLGGRETRPTGLPAGGRFIVATTVRTVLAAFGPGRYQVTWGRRLNVPPVVLTLVASFFESLGGLHDLAGQGRGPAWLTLLSLAIFADGVVRLVLAAVTRGPVGSVFGLPFARLFERWLGQPRSRTGWRSQ